VSADGGITVAGYWGSDASPGSTQIALIRLRRGGGLDTTFGNQGIVLTSVAPAGIRDPLPQIAMDAQGGRIVAGTWGSTDSGTAIVVAAYLSDGRLDSSFGSGGMATTALGGSSAELSDLALGTDGDVILSGSVFAPSTPVLGRLTSGGQLDSAFGSGGTTGVPAAGQLALLPGGGIASFGAPPETPTGPTCRVGAPKLTRLSRDGQIDRSFGRHGTVTAPPALNAGGPFALSAGPGRIAGAAFGGGCEGAPVRVMVVRGNGTRVKRFGRHGVAYGGPSALGINSSDWLLAQKKGGFVAAGSAPLGGGRSVFSLQRFRTNGRADPRFGRDGLVP